MAPRSRARTAWQQDGNECAEVCKKLSGEGLRGVFAGDKLSGWRAFMKTHSNWFLGLVVVVLCGFLPGIERGVAADAASQAALIAEKQEQREKMEALTAKVEDLWTAQAALQKRLSSLGDEFSRVQMEASRGSGKYATKEELQKLSESVKQTVSQAIKELDERREADRKLILDEIRKLAKMPVAVPPAPSGAEPKNGSKGDKIAGSSSSEKGLGGEDSKAHAGSGDGYEYEIKKGENLSTILQAYNEVFKKDGKRAVTLKQVLDLEQNKNIKPNALRPGQKIFIPDPPKK